MLKDSYTRYPRPILWLVRGGQVTIGGGQGDARPRIEVEVAPFYIGKFPVTNEQFEAFDAGFERSMISSGDRDPAASVSFEMAAAYCEWYAGVSRKPMRLPTEVEWQHACHGEAGAGYAEQGSAGCAEQGSAGCAEQGSADDLMWHAGNSGGKVGRLDAKKANDRGLYGMLGGVWEWTESVWREDPVAGPSGDGGVLSGRRVLRGGSVRLEAARITCSLRRVEDPAARRDDVGFRIVKSFR